MADAATMFTPVKLFLALVLDGEPPALSALYRALDELAMAYHHAPDVDSDTNHVEAPRRDQFELRRELAPRFPKLGYYNQFVAIVPLVGSAHIGDALDDVVDIVQELRDVVWLFEHGHVNDALWHFRFGYEHHWGEHLRGLSFYLHELIFVQHAEYETTDPSS